MRVACGDPRRRCLFQSIVDDPVLEQAIGSELLAQLRNEVPEILADLDALADYAVPQTLVLGDLLLNNVPKGIEHTGGPGFGSAVAYVADWGTGVRLLDISDPAAPVEIAFWELAGIAERWSRTGRGRGRAL